MSVGGRLRRLRAASDLVDLNRGYPMFVFLLQAVLLLAIAYILGAVVGCLLRTQFSEKPEHRAAHKPAAQPVADTAAPSSPVAEKPAATAETAVPEARKTSKPKMPAKKPAVAKSATGNKKTAAAPASEANDLKRIKGVGRQIEAKLNAAGITRYEQIAKWTKKDVAEFGEKLSFAGRIEREDWVAQAKKLAKGEMTDFAKRAAKGDVATSKTVSKPGPAGKGKV